MLAGCVMMGARMYKYYDKTANDLKINFINTFRRQDRPHQHPALSKRKTGDRMELWRKSPRNENKMIIKSAIQISGVLSFP